MDATNFSGLEEEPVLPTEELPWYDEVATYLNTSVAVIGCLGVALNVLVLTTIARFEDVTPSYTLMRWLAMYDTLICANYGIRTGILRQLGISVRNLSYVFCKSTDFANHLKKYVAVGMICLLAVERLVAVNWPWVHRRLASTRRANIACVVLLFCCVALALPYSLGVQYINGRCSGMDVGSFIHEYSLVTTWTLRFSLPMIIILLSNSIIILRIRQRQRAGKAKDASSGPATPMLIGISIVFVVCFGVDSLGQVYYFTLTQEEGLKQAFMVYGGLNVARTINSTVNFFVYMYANPKFRSVFLCVASGGENTSTRQLPGNPTQTTPSQ